MFAEFVVLRLQKVTFDVMPPRLVSPVISVTILEVGRPVSVSLPSQGAVCHSRPAKGLRSGYRILDRVYAK